jgi:hypothetical protein
MRTGPDALVRPELPAIHSTTATQVSGQIQLGRLHSYGFFFFCLQCRYPTALLSSMFNNVFFFFNNVSPSSAVNNSLGFLISHKLLSVKWSLSIFIAELYGFHFSETLFLPCVTKSLGRLHPLKKMSEDDHTFLLAS